MTGVSDGADERSRTSVVPSRIFSATATIAVFFALKLALGAAVLIASARWLPVESFATFSQLLVLIAYLTTIGSAGLQNGLIRQLAAAHDNAERAVLEVRAALLIWAVLAATVISLGWLLAEPIAILLVGSLTVAWVIPWLMLLGMLTGLGQLFCAILTGRGHVRAALSTQAIGLLFGCAPALLLLREGMPVLAALLFSAGQSTTTLLAGLRTRLLLINASRTRARVWPQIRRLLQFSAAFLVAASVMPLTLLQLRAIYRSKLGLEALGYWLAANRISDVNTQLMGLYMVQVFLPAFAALAEPSKAWRLVRRSFITVTLVMLLGLGAFILASRTFVTVALSAKFLPAVPLIVIYLVGDMLRASASLGSYAALSRKRLTAYVGLDVAAAILLSVLLLLLLHLQIPNAPALAYVGTYGLLALAAWWLIARLIETEVERQDIPAAVLVT